MLNRLLTRKILSWTAISSGVLIGLFGLIIKGQELVETDPNSDRWLTSRFEAFGPGLLGIVFVVASLTALRNRRRAGLLFIAAAPIVAFILAYPSAGFWFTATNGNVYYILPPLRAAAVLSFLFFGLFYSPLLAIRRRKRAVYVFVSVAVLFILVIAVWDKSQVLLSPLAAWSATAKPTPESAGRQR